MTSCCHPTRRRLYLIVASLFAPATSLRPSPPPLEDAAAIKCVVVIISCRGTHPSIAYIVTHCAITINLVVAVIRRHRHCHRRCIPYPVVPSSSSPSSSSSPVAIVAIVAIDLTVAIVVVVAIIVLIVVVARHAVDFAVRRAVAIGVVVIVARRHRRRRRIPSRLRPSR
jgi:hypothetical protein